MVRTQVYLSAKLYKDVELIAQSAEVPTAQALRDLVERGVRAQRQEASHKSGLIRLSGIIKGGPRDLAHNLDDYLYGDRT